MNTRKHIWETWSDANALSLAAAHFIVQESQRAVAEKGIFTLALSGGKTPEALYRLLASDPFRGNIPWNRTIIAFSDERFVPHTDPESNYRMAKEALLNAVPLPAKNILSVNTENRDAPTAAAQYDRTIRKYVSARSPFDLVLLGLGEEGHTASIFPGSALLKEDRAWVRSVFVPEKQMFRISFTLQSINRSRQVLFLVSGESKKLILQRIRSGKGKALPAARVNPRGGLTWMLDAAAAGK